MQIGVSNPNVPIFPPRVCTLVPFITMYNVHNSCPQFWGLHTEERKQCYEYIIHDNYSVGLDKVRPGTV